MVSSPTPSQFTPPTSPMGSMQPQAQSNKIWGIDKRFFIIALIFLVLVVPVFPRDKVVMVDGTSQTIVNSPSISTNVEVSTISTQSQLSVYTGSFSYFTSMYGGWGSQWYGGSYCGYYTWGWGHRLHCNYSYWPWYNQWQSYGSTVNVTPQMQVVSTQASTANGLETLTLVYANGQSQTYNNVYNDQVQPGGTYSVPSTGTVTNTITNTVMVPVPETVPCTACVTTHVTEHVSILQLIFGF